MSISTDLAEYFAHRPDHALGQCGPTPDEICADHQIELAVAIERERLKREVLAFMENRMHQSWRAELAAIFVEAS